MRAAAAAAAALHTCIAYTELRKNVHFMMGDASRCPEYARCAAAAVVTLHT